MNNRLFFLLWTGLVIALVIALTGCTHLMPQTSQSGIGGPPWRNFVEAKESFDSIIIGFTTTDDLKKTGIDIDAGKIKILGIPKIITLYRSNGSDDLILTEDVTSCLNEYKDDCYGYIIEKEEVFRKGEGSLLKRAFGLERTDRTTQWSARFFILVQDSVVIDKLFIEGTPNGDEYLRKDRDPLGFIKGLIPFVE